MRTTIITLGILCIFSPIILAWLDGVFRFGDDSDPDEADLIRWLSGKPLDTLYSMSGMQRFGFLALAVGVVM
jgi:hypothetical protein